MKKASPDEAFFMPFYYFPTIFYIFFRKDIDKLPLFHYYKHIEPI